MKPAKRDLIVSFGFMLYSLFMFWGSTKIKTAKVNTISAKFMPRTIAALILFLALILFIRALKVLKEEDGTEAAVQEKGTNVVLPVLGVLLAGAIFMKRLGFIPTMVLVLFSVFTMIEEKEKRRYGLYAFLSLMLPVLIHFLFYKGFSVLLPVGVLKFLKYL